MKFKERLSINEYIQVVNEIADNYFDLTTGEYYPHIGEIQAVCIFYNHCVELEEDDAIKVHPIVLLDDMQILFKDEEFMKRYNRAISEKGRFRLNFTNAYNAAMEIVRHRNNDANALTTAIDLGVRNAFKSLADVFTTDDIKALTDVASQVVGGVITPEAIVKAYENSERFKENTESLLTKEENTEEVENVIPMPEKK